MSALLWLAPILIASAGLAAAGVLDRPKPLWALGLWTLAAAAAWLAALRAGRRAKAFLVPLLVQPAVSVWLIVSAPLLFQAGMEWPTLGAFSAPMHWLLRGLGLEVERLDGTLVARSSRLLVVTADWAKLGLWPGLWIALGGSVLVGVLTRERPWRTCALLWLIVAGYVLVRATVLVVLGLHHPDPEFKTGNYPFVTAVFLEPLWQSLTFLPLAGFLAALLPWGAAELQPRPVPWGARSAVAGAAGLALVVGLAAALFFQLRPSGERRSGRVAIDELHSPGWSSAVAPLDKSTFGRDTVYSSTALVRFLEQYYAVTVHGAGKWTDQALAEVDVLILKTATEAFAVEEVDAIERFVRRGGGLFLIGDHTDLLGMTTHLNPVAERFGAAFVKDACNRLHDGQAGSWSPWPFATHPTMSGVKQFDFMTSCTLDLPADAQAVMVVRDAFAEPLDYSRPNFFGDVAPDMDDQLGLATIAGVLDVGEGRLALFGDSTVLSSFCLGWPGHSEYLLKTVEWLNRCPGGRSPIGTWAGGLAGLGLLLAVYLGRRSALLVFGFLLPTGLVLGGLAGIELVKFMHRTSDPLPPAIAPLPELVFVDQGCGLVLESPLLESDFPDEVAFDTLFTWSLRCGIMPRVGALDSASAAEAVALVRPEARWLARRAADLVRYLEGGGALLVLSDDPAVQSALSATLGRTAEELWQAGPPWQVNPQGSGRFAFVGNPALLSRAALGNQIEESPEQDPAHRASGELFQLFEALIPTRS